MRALLLLILAMWLPAAMAQEAPAAPSEGPSAPPEASDAALAAEVPAASPEDTGAAPSPASGDDAAAGPVDPAGPLPALAASEPDLLANVAPEPAAPLTCVLVAAALQCVGSDGAVTLWSPAYEAAEPAPVTIHEASSAVPAAGPAFPILGVVGIAAFGAGAWLSRVRPDRLVEPVPVAALGAKAPPAPADDGPGRSFLEVLVDRVGEEPADAEAQFFLAVELLRSGQTELGLRRLQGAVRITPAVLMPLLQQDEFAAVRAMPEVRRYLRSVHRDRQRMFASYA